MSVATERTAKNIHEWMTAENLRTWLEQLQDEHGPDYIVGMRSTSQCYVAQFARSVLGESVRECGCLSVVMTDGADATFNTDRLMHAHPISRFIREVDCVLRLNSQLTVGKGLSILDEVTP